MVRKKQFINKKTAQHFHVVHRSQRDPKANDPDASKYVLLSSNGQVELAPDKEEDEYESDDFGEDDDESDDDMPDLVDSPRGHNLDGEMPQSFQDAMTAAHKQNKPTAKTKKAAAFATRRVRFGSVEAEDLVDANGMVRDGYDYTQHLKEMGKGRFYSADGQFASQMDLARRVDLPEDVLPSMDEQDRLLEAITLTTETMDADLREALMNDEAFEEMDDDFVVQAAVEDPEADTTDGFDYDAHIAKLMAAASGVPKFRGDLTDDEDEEDEEEMSDEEEDEYADLDKYVGADRSDRQRILDDAFEKMMAEEYDDDQLGELEDDDPETRGDVVLEGELLESIVEDFVHVRQEMLNDEGKLGNPLRTGNRLQEIIEECEKERLADAGDEGETEEEDDPILQQQELQATEEHLRTMFERNAYLAPREEEQWDCETIVSTYSTLDNHPTLIREDGVLKKKKKKKMTMSALDEEALAAAARNKSQIVLSRKTGMPLGVFETETSATKKDKQQQQQQKDSSLPTAPKIKREENKDDKKARKEAAKQQKQQRRQEKKQWKTAFKEEEQRQLTLTQPGKVSVFKYT